VSDATYTFPPDFLWGTATSSHQVEGGNTHNQWHAWEQAGGDHIYQNQVSGKACDWWGGGAEQDIKRMKELHTNAHRLSVEWSRIEPELGRWDQAALDRYRAILTAMRKVGIQPMITLHHFTDPLWLAERGGWLNSDTISLFQKFVQKTVGELSDLCSTWCTINEPSVYAAEAYFEGIFPPGHDHMNEYFAVLFNLLQGHAAAYHTIHDLQSTAQVGLAHHMVAWHARHPSNPLDVLAKNLLDQFFNNSVIDTIQSGLWKPLLGKTLDAGYVKNTLDWIGLNYYVRHNAAFDLRAWKALFMVYGARPSMPHGPKNWGELYPPGLFDLLTRLYDRLALPIYITENGVPDESDTQRPGFILEHLGQVGRAITAGIPVRGYYHWSLVDNFEWADGYDPRFRFGLYRVDFDTQRRTLNMSGELFKDICSTGTIGSDMARRYAPEAAVQLFPGEPVAAS
jgi:beta-glucosidase